MSWDFFLEEADATVLKFYSTHTSFLIFFNRMRNNAMRQPENYVSQSQINKYFVGQAYDLAHRMTFVLVPVAAAILFGTFLPLLYPLALVTLALSFWVDKFLLLKFHSKPAASSAS